MEGHWMESLKQYGVRWKDGRVLQARLRYHDEDKELFDSYWGFVKDFQEHWAKASKEDIPLLLALIQSHAIIDVQFRSGKPVLVGPTSGGVLETLLRGLMEGER